MAGILLVVSCCRKSWAAPLKRRELLQIYASFNEKRLSAEWIQAATRQVEGKEVTQRSAVVADRWLLPSTVTDFFFFLFLFCSSPFLPSFFFFLPGWVTALCTLQKRGLNF